MTVLMIALGHAIPVLFVGLWRRGNRKWLDRTALAMGVVAVLTGAMVREYLVLDLLAVAGAWWLVREIWKKQSA